MPFKVISVPFTFEFDISAERATAPVAGGYGGRVLPLGLRVHQVVCLRDVGESTVRLIQSEWCLRWWVGWGYWRG
jgi:hypothetical protein